MPAPTTPALELIGVRKAFGGHALLDGVDLGVARGERVALRGESGSGKSTLLNLVAGLEPVDAGTVRVAGTEVSALGADDAAAFRRDAIGFVFQAFHLIAGRTALENVVLGLTYGPDRSRDRARAATDILVRLGLEHRLYARPETLSGGEKQRVALARAVVARPSLLLCDEPTGNLDSAATESVLDIIEELHRDGMTVVMITHDDAVAAKAARRAEIEDGRVES